jgi:hypothetical protein
VLVYERFHDCYFLNIFLEKVSEMIPSVWYFMLRNSVDMDGMFLSRFLRRKHLLDNVSQKQISCDLCASFACAK